MSGTHVLYARPEDEPVGEPLAELSVAGTTTVVESVRSVAELAERLPAHPDVVVTEYRLPGRETGLDALGRVRAFDPELPVVLCTAAPDGAVASAATRLGVTEYVARTNDAGVSVSDRVAALLTDDAE